MALDALATDVAALTPVPTGMSDEAYQTLVDAAAAAVAGRIGPPPGRVTEYHDGDLHLIQLAHVPDAVPGMVVTEWPDTDTARVLDDDDYRIEEHWIRRLDTGTTPAYLFGRGQVSFTYDAADDYPTRVSVIAKLVQQDLSYAPGMTAENIDGYGYQQANNAAWNYGAEREAILSTLDGAPLPTFA